MDFKFRRGSITANNDTAPVNGIGLNTPDGVKYLSGESGDLQFGGKAIGGGGGVQIVNFTLNGDGTATADFTLAEILSAHKNGSVVIGEFSSNGANCVLQLTAYGDDEMAMFIGFENTGDSLGVYTIAITTEGCMALNNRISF